MRDKSTGAQLVERTLKGDMSEYGILVNRYRSLAYGLACHVIGSFQDAEDITQEAFIKAYDSLSTLKDKAKFGSWLRVITLNLCKMWLRKSVGRDSYLDINLSSLETQRFDKFSAGSTNEDDVDSSPLAPRASRQAGLTTNITPEDICLNTEFRETIFTALSALPPQNQAVITLFYLDDLSYKEIGDFLNPPISTVQSRLQRARKQLKEDIMQDIYWSEPQAPYEQRRRLYLQYCAAHSLRGRDGFFSQIARLELGQQAVDEYPIREAIKIIDKRMDCSDFSVGGLLRILYLYRDSPLISQELIAEIEACLLRFKYWWDEPGEDWCCYHSENHQLIYHSDELLAGQLFKERIFQNDGKNGRYHIEHASHLIQRWFDFRVKFGFSEWLSNNYFEVDLLGLVNLYDFAENDEIRSRAKMLIDIIMFEMALHTYRGVFGCTHGRAYAGRIKGGRLEHSASTGKLMFGMSLFNKPNALGAIPLATSSYRCPPIIEAIANDLHEPILSKERHSLNVEDAPRYGLSYDNIKDGLLFWSIGVLLHPKVFALSKRISELYGVRQHEDYDKRYNGLFQGK